MNEGKMFGNQGSPEQIKEAEKHMSFDEKAASDSREIRANVNRHAAEELSKLGIKGELYLLSGKAGSDILKGNIDGHEILIDYNENPPLGTINGIELKREQIDDLYEKYQKYAMLNPSNENNEHFLRAQQTTREKTADSLVRELLGKLEK